MSALARLPLTVEEAACLRPHAVDLPPRRYPSRSTLAGRQPPNRPNSADRPLNIPKITLARERQRERGRWPRPWREASRSGAGAFEVWRGDGRSPEGCRGSEAGLQSLPMEARRRGKRGGVHILTELPHCRTFPGFALFLTVPRAPPSVALALSPPLTLDSLLTSHPPSFSPRTVPLRPTDRMNRRRQTR